MKTQSLTLPEQIRLTYEDYAKLPNDGLRYEVLDGELSISPAPTPKHEEVQMALYDQLKPFILKHRLGRLFVAPQDVVLAEHTVVQPDLFFIAAERLGIVDDVNTKGAPDLVVEIESDHDERADWVKKLPLYDKHGVKEVWHVRPNPRAVDVYRRVARKLDHVERVTGAGKLTTPILPKLAVVLKQLWA